MVGLLCYNSTVRTYVRSYFYFILFFCFDAVLIFYAHVATFVYSAYKYVGEQHEALCTLGVGEANEGVRLKR